MTPEAAARASALFQAYGELRSKVFAASAFEPRIRTSLACSLCFTRLEYNLHVASQLTRKHLAKLETALVRPLALIAGA
eukprot:3416508-Alexandrium_andersonii.AAC.1